MVVENYISNEAKLQTSPSKGGKKYAFANDQSMDPDFKGALYSGDGVVQDGFIITSGTCPWMAKSTGRKEGTAELSNALIAVIKTLNK